MADDVVVVEFQGKITQLEGEIKKLEKDYAGLSATGVKSYKQIEAEGKKAATETDKVAGKVVNLKDKFGELANSLPFVSQIKQVTELGSAMVGLGGAAQKSSTGFNVLKTAIIGTGIGALVIAIIGLIAYFKRTDEGAAKLSGVMSALGAAADLVTGAVVGIGEAVFNAIKSFDSFGDAIQSIFTNIVNVAIDQVVVRVQALFTIFQVLGTTIKEFATTGSADFEAAASQINKANLDLLTGVKDTQDGINGFIDTMSAAAQAAYNWEIAMDALDDKIRQDSITIANNEKQITKLIISAKNKQVADEVALGNLERASQLEKQNLAITLQNESAKLKLIQERNKRESNSINQDIGNGETRRSINDNLAQEEVDQINKITKLEQQSADLQEKIENRKDGKKEEIFQNNLKRIEAEETLQENLAKEEFLTGTKTAQQLEDALYKIKLGGLLKQKELLLTESRDVVAIDKAIIDLELQNRIKGDKDLETEDKARTAAALKEQQERLKKEQQYADEAKKKKEDAEKAHEAKILMIKQSGVDVAQTLVQGFYDNSQTKRQQDLDEELKKSQIETDEKTLALQKQLDSGLISQEQFDAKKAVLDKKQAATEASIKKKQFDAEKKAALIGIAIDTAASIVKTIATLGIPAGLAGAAVAAALGLAQAAVVSAQPVPKFKDGIIDLPGPGTGTSDSIVARLSRGESVMTAQETMKYRPALESMRDGTFDIDYTNGTHILPALHSIEAKNNRERAQRSERNENKMNAILNNLSFDTTNLERSIKGNKNVGINNTEALAKAIARQMQLNGNWYK